MSSEQERKDIAASIGARVCELRTKQKIPPGLVAEAVGMSEEDYIAAEKGETRFQSEKLLLIARTLGVDIGDILTVL